MRWEEPEPENHHQAEEAAAPTRKASCPSWCGRCYENVRKRANHKGHRGYRKPRGITGADVKKPPTTPTPNGSHGPSGPRLRDSDFASRYPHLYERLTCCKWDDGTTRITDTLLLFVKDGILTGCLKDRNTNCSAFLSAPTYTQLLEGLEAGLDTDSLIFKPNRG